MPICFDMREFAIVTGLNCHMPAAYDDTKVSTKVKNRRKKILDVVGRTCKEKELVEHLKSDNVRKGIKKSLYLLYFLHNILYGIDPNTNIPHEWVSLSADRDAFSAYLWGRKSYSLIIKYLLSIVNSNVKTTNLYDFPWTFMCWTFEAMLHIRKKLKRKRYW